MNETTYQMSSQSPSRISSNDVCGTSVFGADGSEVGHIDHLMIDKETGNVAYAVMGFGGFLGMGEDHYPVPWRKLKFDTSKDGYVTNITETQLRGAPERSENWSQDREWDRRVYDHYGLPYYWM